MGSKLAKRRLDGEIIVDETTYFWRISREPQYSSAYGWTGMILSIRISENRRELLLEFPDMSTKSRSVPYRVRPRVEPAKIVAGIREAIQAGWEPDSRGKPFEFTFRALTLLALHKSPDRS